MAELDPAKVPKATSSISYGEGIAVLELAGELDVSSVHDVRSTADRLIQQNPDHVVLDLTELTFMDSSGIALFLWIANRVPRIELRNPSPIIRQLLEITGLTEALPIAK